MISTLGLNCHITEPTLGASAGNFLEDVGARLTGYGHTIVATGGFESADLTLAVRDLEEGLTWLGRLLCGLTVWDRDAELVWDGFIAQVVVAAGAHRRQISLDPIANRVRCRYTTPLGVATSTAQAGNATSQARYGVRDGVLSLDRLTLAEAEGYRDQWLGRYALPRETREGELRTGADGEGGVTVTISAAGWYTTLGWATLERTDQTQEAVTAQAATLISGSSPGIGAINGFLSTSAAQIVATGRSATRAIAADTTYREAIERRLALGSSTGERYAWGVFDAARRLTVRAWAGATPSTITYRSRLGGARLETASGTEVPLWLARPDAMVEDVDFVAVGPTPGAIDTPAASYRERVAFRADSGGMSLSFEPEASDSLTARLARLS